MINIYCILYFGIINVKDAAVTDIRKNTRLGPYPV